MGDITKNLSRSEIVCPCGCGFDRLNPAVARGFQYIRDRLGQAVHVNSGCRCAKYNATLKGSSPTSQHIVGNALDIRPDDPKALIDLLRLAHEVPVFAAGGIGVYNGRIHVDAKGVWRRWNKCSRGKGPKYV